MASSPLCSWVLLFMVVVSWSWSDVCTAGKTYIVRMDKTQMPESYETHSQWYTAELDGVSVSDSASNRVLYSYDSAFHGFAAELESEELESLLKSDSVMGVYEDELYHLHTTRTPEFLGLDRDESLWDGHGGGAAQGLDSASEEVVIGVLDTGVWPESKSFDDFGMGPVPSRWRGGCEAGPDFSPSLCNRKLIGARSFSGGYETALGGGSGGLPGKKPAGEVVSARDRDGHGTHTASTAAGSRVANASLLGYASGTARGMATRSRVAAYKVCWSSGCFSSDILAGMDRAIDDGVDVMSLSLGGNAAPYYRDTIAIGAFSAMQRGIFVSCSAGNSGPAAASLANTAPWITTVGAGTIDRDFPAYAALGNGKAAAGVSLYSGRGLGGRKFRLVYAAAAAIKRGFGNSAMAATNSSGLCMPGTLDPKLVRGKIVLCDRGVNARVEKGSVVAAAGGVGMVLANTAANGEELVADSHLLPAVAVGKLTGDMIREYIRTSVNPTAMLSFRGTVVGIKPSPIVAAFSSRGPNIVTPEILKPDIIGPGVNILAGWSPSVGPSGLARDNRKSDFNIISGTSMSCPHISGVAALLKAAHPGWSPSAIRSALMTTAYTLDSSNSPLRDAATGSASNPLAYGSGHVDPQMALSPGLVYDITPEDYVEFLCSVNYTPIQFQMLTKKTMTNCSRRFSNPGQLNYPSFSVVFSSGMETITYGRELTNVGSVNGAEYTVTVSSPPGVVVKVSPGRLVFKGVGSKLRYQVSFVARKGYKGEREFGWISWSDGQHVVRSPLAFAWNWRG